MKVRDVMKAPVRSVERSETVGRALEVMHQHRIRHLPVLDDQKLVGILSIRDISKPGLPGRWHEVPWLSGTPVEWVMTSPVTVLPPNASVSSAASLMRDERIDCIPILDAGRLVGIVTSTDLLQLVEDRETETRRPGHGRAIGGMEG